MTFKRSRFIHLGWILIILCTTLFTGLFYAENRNISLLTGGGFLLLLEISLFLSYLNTNTRQIQMLFQSLENQDTSIRFTSRDSFWTKGELADSLNHAIRVFHESMLEYAAREQLLLAMIEHAKTGFISIDEHGDFEMMNKEARSLLDCDQTSSLSRLKTEDAGLYALIRKLGPGSQQSYKIATNEGPRSLKISSAEIRHHNKVLTLISLQDIQHEIETKEIESWQKLMRILNHEIMNSIAPIISASKSLMPIFVHDRNPVTPSDLDQEKILQTISGLEVIESMGTGLQRFVSNYRKLSKIPEPNIREVDPVKWTQSLKQLVSDSLPGASLSVDIRIDTDMVPLRIDDKMFNQVLLNLVHNAWEAPEGESRKKIWITLGRNRQDKYCIQVINNGQPIPEEIREQIFVPFFTTKEKGSGIGLYVTRLIVNAHSASISVYTRADGRTVFEINR